MTDQAIQPSATPVDPAALLERVRARARSKGGKRTHVDVPIGSDLLVRYGRIEWERYLELLDNDEPITSHLDVIVAACRGIYMANPDPDGDPIQLPDPTGEPGPLTFDDPDLLTALDVTGTPKALEESRIERRTARWTTMVVFAEYADPQHPEQEAQEHGKVIGLFLRGSLPEVDDDIVEGSSARPRPASSDAPTPSA